jgi:sugar/nucleoside kinase (ribokinase family)
MDAVIIGNVTLDVICYPITDVPRNDSIRFEQVAIGPGGCGSNVAVGLTSLGIPTALVACIGDDEAGSIVKNSWKRIELDDRYVQQVKGKSTGISVGLVDDEAQPRFIHTPGANTNLSMDDIDIHTFLQHGVRLIHIAGYFVLPGLLDIRLGEILGEAKSYGIITSLDVVNSPNMKDTSSLLPCLPHLDYFFCNIDEGYRITGKSIPQEIGQFFRARGVKNSIIKMGAEGCYLMGDGYTGTVPVHKVDVVDTTGAGDAFAAGFISALLSGDDVVTACKRGNEAGARMVGVLGAVSGWQV